MLKKIFVISALFVSQNQFGAEQVQPNAQLLPEIEQGFRVCCFRNVTKKNISQLITYGLVYSAGMMTTLGVYRLAGGCKSKQD